MTIRGIETLKQVEVIAAEDTRHSKKLLDHYQISTQLIRLDAHTIHERALTVFKHYDSLAYISDAGTPGISDPGQELLRLALAHHWEVEVLPGATAFVPALLLSGFATQRFSFEGFLPRKGKERQDRLDYICQSPLTSIIYESPKRLLKTLQGLQERLEPARQIAVCRELSKRFESTYRGTVTEVIASLDNPIKGEIAVVIAAQQTQPKTSYADLLAVLSEAGLEATDLRRALQAAGASRNEAYQLVLEDSQQ
jgi:16S rRNA (cytidine1402-2'-O)-methyltransferase